MLTSSPDYMLTSPPFHLSTSRLNALVPTTLLGCTALEAASSHPLYRAIKMAGKSAAQAQILREIKAIERATVLPNRLLLDQFIKMLQSCSNLHDRHTDVKGTDQALDVSTGLYDALHVHHGFCNSALAVVETLPNNSILPPDPECARVHLYTIYHHHILHVLCVTRLLANSTRALKQRISFKASTTLPCHTPFIMVSSH
jgi:hypothetical protein